MRPPPPDELLPHTGPMLWLDAVLSSGPDGTVCEARPDATHPLARDGRLPGLVAIEWIAQAAAAHAGLARRARGERPEPGVITGCRGVELPAEGFALAPVTIEVRTADDRGRLAVFEGVVLQGGRAVARGEVTVLRGLAPGGPDGT